VTYIFASESIWALVAVPGEHDILFCSRRITNEVASFVQVIGTTFTFERLSSSRRNFDPTDRLGRGPSRGRFPLILGAFTVVPCKHNFLPRSRGVANESKVFVRCNVRIRSAASKCLFIRWAGMQDSGGLQLNFRVRGALGTRYAACLNY
jgi:hypothetical protein